MMIGRQHEAQREQRGQNAAMQQQWEKLGHTPESAAPIITERFDYEVRPLALLLTAAPLLLVVATTAFFIWRQKSKR